MLAKYEKLKEKNKIPQASHRVFAFVPCKKSRSDTGN